MYKQLFEQKKKPQFFLILILFGKIYKLISFCTSPYKEEWEPCYENVSVSEQ